jgi:putative copper resistance protein D
MIGIRFALYASLMLLFGMPLFALYALKGEERAHGQVLPFRGIAIGLALLATGLSALSLVMMTASMAGVPLLETDSASVSMMISETPMGHAWVARMAALLLTVSCAVAIGGRRSSTWLALVSIGSAIALGSLAWTGHGAASEGTAGTRQLIADIVHLLASGAWIGALAALASILFRAYAAMTNDRLRMTHRALDRFSVIGTVVVALIVVSGLVNSYMLVGPAHILSLPSTLYGQLLIAKLALFGVMLGLAAANRFRHTPTLDRAIDRNETSKAVAALRRSLIFEMGAALTILGLVAWLGTLQPPMAM